MDTNNTETMLFIGDNGECNCWNHTGYAIRNTGRDISGLPAIKMTPEDAQAMGISCETCRGEA
jgi:hypothetical protein